MRKRILTTQAGSHDQAFHIISHHGFDQAGKLLGILFGRREYGCVPFLVGKPFKASAYIRKERISDIGNDHGYGMGPSAP